jgi:ribonuclease HII
LTIIGVDEAGRGPLVGSVVAAAVVFPANFYFEGLTDSKKLTEKSVKTYTLKLQNNVTGL